MKISSEIEVGPIDFGSQNFFSQEFSQGDFLVNGTQGQDSPVKINFNLKLIATEGILVLICSIISIIVTEKSLPKSDLGKDSKTEFQISHIFSMEQGR